ncbi:MAG: hypothetical protein GX442_08855 [Candidatus Riflebacteria bacterium]|nr:hypothetical protein [Candidatus Riflebacteria bacterium]
MKARCMSCGFAWEATRLDPFVLRCGFCRDLTCERCGRHEHATIHVCPSCFKWKGHELEDIVVSACHSCHWVRPLGKVGTVSGWSHFCPECEQGKRPADLPENPAAFTREQFRRRVRNFFGPPPVEPDPGSDLLPFTVEKHRQWEAAAAFGNTARAIAQAAFHRDAASERGLIDLFALDRYLLKEICLALGRIDRPAGHTFLRDRVAALDAEPYFCGLALAGLAETPGLRALESVCGVMARNHCSQTPAFCLELLLKMEWQEPGFWFAPRTAERLRAALASGCLERLPQHLVYFRDAIQPAPGAAP